MKDNKDMIIIIQTNFIPLLKCLIYVINMNKLLIKLLVCTKHLTVEAHPFVGSNFQCFFNQIKGIFTPSNQCIQSGSSSCGGVFTVYNLMQEECFREHPQNTNRF